MRPITPYRCRDGAALAAYLQSPEGRRTVDLLTVTYRDGRVYALRIRTWFFWLAIVAAFATAIAMAIAAP